MNENIVMIDLISAKGSLWCPLHIAPLRIASPQELLRVHRYSPGTGTRWRTRESRTSLQILKEVKTRLICAEEASPACTSPLKSFIHWSVFLRQTAVSSRPLLSRTPASLRRVADHLCRDSPVVQTTLFISCTSSLSCRCCRPMCCGGVATRPLWACGRLAVKLNDF